jgi:DNA polymerase-1
VDKLNKKKDKKTLVLLDSHAIIHRAYHALPDFASSTGIPTGALYGLSTMLMGILEKFKPNYIVACYDLPQPTYRHEAYKDYKGGRKKTDDALVEQLKSSRNIFKAFNIPMVDKVGFEADDMLGTIVHEVLERKEMENINIVIASGDMDTLQLVTGDRVRVFTLSKAL